jgi:hypothetical protein
MKKTLAIAFLAVISLASCKKDHNCVCTVTTTTPEFSYLGSVVQQASTTTTSGTSIINDTKANAETTCTAGSASTSIASQYASLGAGATTVVTTCSIQ